MRVIPVRWQIPVLERPVDAKDLLKVLLGHIPTQVSHAESLGWRRSFTNGRARGAAGGTGNPAGRTGHTSRGARGAAWGPRAPESFLFS